MVPDTGSSDTWVARDGFRCLDPSIGRPVNPKNCGFGALFRGDFPGGPIADGDQQMHISYLSGDFLQGPMGYAESVTTPLRPRAPPLFELRWKIEVLTNRQRDRGQRDGTAAADLAGGRGVVRRRRGVERDPGAGVAGAHIGVPGLEPRGGAVLPTCRNHGR